MAGGNRRPRLRVVPAYLDNLAVVEDPGHRSATASFLPTHWTLSNYSPVFKTSISSRRRCSELDRDRADHHGGWRCASPSVAAYAITRLDFPGKTLILAGALAVTMFPAISIVGGLYNVWRTRRPVRHLAGPDPALPVVLARRSPSTSCPHSSARYPGTSRRPPQMDGATPLQAFRRVILPLAIPGRVHRQASSRSSRRGTTSCSPTC